MIFEIIGPDGYPKMGTNQSSCLYDKPILMQMHKAGYRFKYKNKYIKINDLLSIVGQSGASKSGSASHGCRILCEETGQVFESQSAAGRYFNIDPAYISECVRKQILCKGYTFRKVASCD